MTKIKVITGCVQGATKKLNPLPSTNGFIPKIWPKVKQIDYMGTLFSKEKKSWQTGGDLFTFIDLFAGIGGFRIAFEELGGKCLFTSEIDAECARTYQVNFNDHPDGDITQIDVKDIPKHDILCAGFPCQPFSISGHKKGFSDTRGTLFFNVLEIIKKRKPQVVFLENVKHLKDHDNQNTLNVILKSLEDTGYIPEWKIINAKDFGVAQNRERIIIIAHRKKTFDFSEIPHQPEILLKDILDVTGDFEYLKPDEYTILPKNIWKKQRSGLIFCGHRNKAIRKNGVRENTEHLSRVHKQPNRIYHIDGTHPTIPSQETSGRFWIYDNKSVRKLTIDECFRLQGFPSDFEKVSSIGASYNQVGNAVAVPMIKAVGEEVIKQLM